VRAGEVIPAKITWRDWDYNLAKIVPSGGIETDVYYTYPAVLRRDSYIAVWGVLSEVESRNDLGRSEIANTANNCASPRARAHARTTYLGAQVAIEGGRLGPFAGLTHRRAATATCPECGAEVIRGLDAEVGGRCVDADPLPLSAAGEALTRLGGSRTYELVRTGGRLELDQRDQWRIRGRPAGGARTGDVLAGHRCGMEAPESWWAPSRHVTRNRPQAPTEPPF